MLRNRRPLKSALMRPKWHSSLLSPLPWSFWRSGFGSHTHTQPHHYRPTRSWRTGCIRVVSAATLVPAFGKTFEIFWWLVSWPGCYCSIYFSKFFFFPFFHFSVSMRSKRVMSLGAATSSSAIPQGLFSEVRGPSSSRFNLKTTGACSRQPRQESRTRWSDYILSLWHL